MVGFSWALFIAGSPLTAVSQWKVDENSTNELMFAFHENVVRSARPPQLAGGAAEALQKSLIEIDGIDGILAPLLLGGICPHRGRKLVTALYIRGVQVIVLVVPSSLI
jgi:hypothetical protein